MTHERICGPQRQPCPTPWLCGIDCNFQSAEVETARQFWSNPGYTHTILDAPGNWWDRRGFFGKLATVIGAVVACLLAAVLVVPR